MNNTGLLDNHTRGKVAEFLTEKIRDGSSLSVVSAYFTIYAYDALKETLDKIDHLDFLFGDPYSVNRLAPSKTDRKSFFIDSDGLEIANKLQQKRVAKECADMSHYYGLLKKTLASIEHTFQKRAATSLLSSRGAVLPSVMEAPTSRGADFDLVTWLVIMREE